MADKNVKRNDYENYFTPDQLRGHRDGNIDGPIVNLVEPGMKVLDCGAGVGILAKKLQDKGAMVVATDLKPNFVEEILKGGVFATMADINKLPFKDKMFDLAIAEEVIEHLENPGQGLSELFRVAKKVMFTLPKSNGEPWHLWHCDVHEAGSARLFVFTDLR